MNMTSAKKTTKYEPDIHNLYWCTTPDHGDDALIVAASKQQAMQVLAETLGCEPKEVTATLVKNLKASLGIDYLEAGYVEDSILKACSASIIQIGPSRVVYLGGRCYVEGILDFVMEQLRGQMGPEGLKEFLGR